MIRPIMTYGMEAGRGGMEDARLQDMEKLLYQALLKATGGIQGSKQETINQIAAVESIQAKLSSMQTRHIARNLTRPSVNRDNYPPT